MRPLLWCFVHGGTRDVASVAFSMDGKHKLLYLNYVVATFGINMRDCLAKARGQGQVACWAAHFVPLAQAALQTEDFDATSHFLRSMCSRVRECIGEGWI